MLLYEGTVGNDDVVGMAGLVALYVSGILPKDFAEARTGAAAGTSALDEWPGIEKDAPDGIGRADPCGMDALDRALGKEKEPPDGRRPLDVILILETGDVETVCWCLGLTDARNPVWLP